VRIIFKYGGIVDKYIGDALMAVFGTIEDQVDPEFRAVKAAFEFKQAISEMNQERAAIGREPISIGVGVNTGKSFFTQANYYRDLLEVLKEWNTLLSVILSIHRLECARLHHRIKY
jgi:class 3 adenylate cyclase